MIAQRLQRLAIGAAAVACSGLLVGCASLADAAPHTQPAPAQDNGVAARAGVTYLAECLDDELVQRPGTYTLACADGNERLEKLSWSGWGEDKATATGELVTATCEPSCAAGKTLRYAVRVEASALAEGEAAATYRTLTVSSVGKPPAGYAETETYQLPGITPGGPGTMADAPADSPSATPSATPSR